MLSKNEKLSEAVISKNNDNDDHNDNDGSIKMLSPLSTNIFVPLNFS